MKPLRQIKAYELGPGNARPSRRGCVAKDDGFLGRLAISSPGWPAGRTRPTERVGLLHYLFRGIRRRVIFLQVFNVFDGNCKQISIGPIVVNWN